MNDFFLSHYIFHNLQVANLFQMEYLTICVHCKFSRFLSLSNQPALSNIHIRIKYPSKQKVNFWRRWEHEKITIDESKGKMITYSYKEMHRKIINLERNVSRVFHHKKKRTQHSPTSKQQKISYMRHKEMGIIMS